MINMQNFTMIYEFELLNIHYQTVDIMYDLVCLLYLGNQVLNQWNEI